MLDEEKDISQYVMFGPRNGKMLKSNHPEIANHQEFSDLPNDEFYFVWLIASQSSQIDPELPEQMRRSIAAKTAFKDKTKMEKFSAGDYNDKVKTAIEKMKTFSPIARYLAKRTIQNAFANIQKLTNVDMDDFKNEEIVDGIKITTINWSGRKQYVDTVAKISEILPGMITQLEHGFGIDVKTGKEIETERLIDKHHQRKKDSI